MKQIFLIYSVQGNQTQKTLVFFLSATCSTEEKIKGRTSHHLTIDDKHTNGWGKFTPPLSLPPPLIRLSPLFLNQCFVLQRYTERKEVVTRIWGHTWEFNARILRSYRHHRVSSPIYHPKYCFSFLLSITVVLIVSEPLLMQNSCLNKMTDT